jgi:predicted AlkP superfamily pyrophosphatase or phosphodiesterase
MDMGDEEVTVFLMNYVDCYQEYLAHLEFMKKFANDIRFIDLKKVFASYLANFDRIIENIRKFIEQGLAEELEKNQFSMSARLYAIIYDALFFYVAKDDSFQKWCKEREMMNLCLFSSWILEDFEYIRRLKLDRKEEMDKISMSGWLSTSVNPLKLLLGQIDFDVDTKETRIFDEEKDADLALLWEKRRSSYQN